MDELRNCPQCDRLFVYRGRNLCPQCLEKEEEEFMLVRRYVRDHPGATVFETAEATGVSEEKILRFLREGRLVSRGLKSSVVLKCERCGKVIEEGRYCRSCLAELEGGLKRAADGLKKPAGEREAKMGRERMYVTDLGKPGDMKGQDKEK